MQRYRDVLDKLRDAIDEFEQSGNKLTPLRELCDELEKQVNEVTTVEEGVDAVRNQIIDPVNKELAQGRRISKFSLAFGAAGFLAAIVGALYPALREDPNAGVFGEIRDAVISTNTEIDQLRNNARESDASLQRMMQRAVAQSGLAPLVAEELAPSPDEQFYQIHRKVIALADPEKISDQVSLQVDHVDRLSPFSHDDTHIMVADVRVYVNNRLLDESALDSVVRVESAWPTDSIHGGRQRGMVRVTEEDTLVLLDVHRFSVTKVMSNQTLNRPLADSQTGMLLLPLTTASN